MSDRSISEAIKYHAGTHQIDNVTSIDAQVVSVDLPTRTCVVTLVGGKANNDIPDVRLMASVDDGFLCMPEEGSTVTIIMTDYGDPYVTSFSGIDKIIMRGGDLGGLLKLLPTLDAINKIQKDINEIKNAFSAWVVSPNDGGAALKSIAANWFGSPLTITIREDLENVNITQG